jgi:serine/threonine protein kinase
MTKLKAVLSFETTFGIYKVDEILGEGGAGRVYGGTDTENHPVAIKLLARERATSEKRKRFKNEIAFLTRFKHRNLVAVIDHGVSIDGKGSDPFYIMPRYDHSLRVLIHEKIKKNEILPFFSQILDGTEAAHFKNVIHRDLKPENILHDKSTNTLAIADFGIARFTEEELVATAVETQENARMGNFQYAAPEQRTPGGDIRSAADIYSLGLILNEMFTGSVPHGTAYKQIGDVAPEYAFLDQIVSAMLRQSPGDRPDSIAAVKLQIQRHEAEAVTLQKLNQSQEEVVPAAEIDEPLANEPMRIINVDWSRGLLTIYLDRPTTKDWRRAIQNLGSYSSVYGKGPEAFTFDGNHAIVEASEHQVQDIINHFKNWLPRASLVLRSDLELRARKLDEERRRRLQLEREAEEQRLRVLRNVRF